MKKKTSRKRHLFLTKNFIMMLVMLVVIIVAVSAWFTVNKKVEANNISVEAISSEIDIAPCIKTYDNEYNVLKDGPGAFGNEVKFEFPTELYDGKFTKDCTGDGVNLYVPDFNVTNDFDSVRVNGGKDVNTNIAGRDAISQEDSRIEVLKHPGQDPPEYHYYEFEFYARSKNENLIMTADSQVLSLTEAPTSKGGRGLSLGLLPDSNSSVADKRSAYGNFNVDGLVGAVRVSLLAEACNVVHQSWAPTSGDGVGYVVDTDAPKTENSEIVRTDMVKQLLWYPRPDVLIHIPETSGDITNWTLLTNRTVADSSGDSFTNTYYKNDNVNGGMLFVSNDTDSKTVVPAVTSGSIPTLGTDTNITDFDDYCTKHSFTRQKVSIPVDANAYSQQDEYYVTKYTLRVWIEGSDTEARRAMDGGQFGITLRLK